MEIITQELVKELFEYHEDGYLIWKASTRNNKRKAGDRAGFFQKQGKTGKRRCVIGINKKLYKAHRLIFLLHNGYLPITVDHKDRNQLNDKIENLRPATYSENNRNRSSEIGSSSKHKGVTLDKSVNKWKASIRINGKHKNIGHFENEKDAALKYNDFARVVHGDFANLNNVD